jgi:hypothetical protein
MAIKTFTTGEVLTAADTNTYLANAGLDYITQTAFSAVTQVIIDNCFTATYANYRLVLDLSAMSANDVILYQWRTGGSSGSTYGSANYDNQIVYSEGGLVGSLAQMGQVFGRIGYCYATPGFGAYPMEIINPYAALRTQVLANTNTVNGTTNVTWEANNSVMRVTDSFTGIRIGNLNGTRTMTGRLRVYGYRNA